jgi:hypothetical protein
MKKTTIRASLLIGALTASAAMVAGQALRTTSQTSQTSTAANPAYKPPRTPDGQPDLQGIWQVRNTANWDVQSHGSAYRIPAGLGVVEGEEIPYLPWAAAKKQENFKNRLTEDPVEKCYMAGVPRTMYLPYPVQILQTPEAVVIVSSYVHAWRWIPTVALPRYDGYEAWMGDPRGRWEGNTLIVESIGFNGQTWFDHSGNFHSDALKLTERFTRSAADAISYEVTIDDPKVFTRPWRMRMPLYLHNDMLRVLEDECYLDAEEAGKPIRGAHPEDRRGVQ